MEYGDAIQKMVANNIRGNRLWSSLYKPILGPNNPDIIGVGLFNNLKLEITTNTERQIISHLSRPYGANLIIVTYSRPLGFIVFP